MSRRSTPSRLYAAHRAATIARLIGDLRELPERAEARVAAYEVQTARDGRPRDGGTGTRRIAGSSIGPPADRDRRPAARGNTPGV